MSLMPTGLKVRFVMMFAKDVLCVVLLIPHIINAPSIGLACARQA